MIPKPLDAITGQDIDDLVANQVAEGRTLDYKRELPGSTDTDKKEFLADVSSFANSIGGELIFGIEESGGIPTSIPGLVGLDLDAEQRRLDSIILAGIEPRIPYRIRSLVTANGVPVLILRVGQSWEAPHRVVLKQHDRFYARSSAGKYALDTGELRQAFVRAANTEDSIERFVAERLVEIDASRTPVQLVEGGRIALHLVPLQAIARRTSYEMTALQIAQNRVIPISTSGWNNRITLHGVLTYVPVNTQALGYAQLYRSGIIESVDAGLLLPHDDGRILLPSIAFEQRIMKAAKAYFEALQQMGVEPPIYCFVSMLRARGVVMGVDAFRLGMQHIVSLDQNVIALPPSVLMDYSEKPARVFRAAFDAIWNAFGFEGSPNFDPSGEWSPSR